ncbi:exoribonuclease II [Aspergillus undulatus]|uniref:exoribonuclease II n=1 Tax=Aspergillus undulatus TaxID=1810928 RepID=UPI003CCD84A9
MPLILSRARAVGRTPGWGFVPKFGQSISAGARSHPMPWTKVSRSVLARRYINNEGKVEKEAANEPVLNDMLWTPTSIEDLRLKQEFEEKRDIRDYLRKWLEITPNTLDPVRDLESKHTPPGTPWIGNMVTRTDGSAESENTLRRTDEENSDYTDIGNEGEGMHDYLEPGDLVAFKYSDDVLRLAIYVKSVKKQQQFYTRRGLWRIAHPVDVDFVLKGFTTPESVACLIPYFPDDTAELHPEMQTTLEGGVPREIGAHLLRMLDDFGSQAHELYRVNSARFDHIYEIVADEKVQLHMTLEELACRALGIELDQINDVIRYAVHKAIRRFPFLIDSDRSSVFTNQYVVYPTPIAEILNTVMTWYHEHQRSHVSTVTAERTAEWDHPLQRFIVKAQRMIRRSRKIRSPTTMANVGPSSHRFLPGQDNNPLVYREMPSEDFTDNDKVIIHFLKLWCVPPLRMTSPTLQSIGSHIMRATGMYSQMNLTHRAAPLFLQELGVFTPWENLRLLDQDVALPGHGLGGDAEWKEVQEACDELLHSKPKDQMNALRKDWGQLPVYCIDDVGAEEIDDGVSLERIPGSDDTFWIRVHIANPSAFIDSTSIIMEHAKSRLHTLYSPERTYPMLPKAMTQKHFSLGPGRPTLTFSAKMNLQGEVLETDISNGVVQNVIYITHDKLRSVFGLTAPESEPLIVGGKLETRSRASLQDELSPNDENRFQILRQLMLAFREQRLKNGAIEFPYRGNTSVSVSFGSTSPEPSGVKVDTGRYFLGDPIIQLRPKQVNPHEVLDVTKNDLVSTLMNLACWVSAKWCAERNIPAVFDGTYYHPEYAKLTNENVSEYGGEGFLSLAPPRGVSVSRPIPHVPLGLDAYLKSTSPLRRYTDLIVHYQIEATLRFEHEHKRRLNAAEEADAAVLPFSHNSIEEFISRSRWKRNRLQLIDRTSKQLWACMLLFRGFYFGECKLPETFECLVHKPISTTILAGETRNDGFMGVITSLGVRCSITVPPEMTGVDILSVVEAKITEVNVGRGVVIMDATRVVKPFQRVEAA